MKNIIAQRIADFLAPFAPFSDLSFDDLVKVSSEIKIMNLEKNKTLFKINDNLHDCFYVVASGSINLSVISDAEETLLNNCTTGDILGLRPFFAKNNYLITATAKDEAIVYGIPISVFRPFVANNEKVLDFLLQSFASTAQTSGNKKNNLINDAVQFGDNQTEIQYYQPLDYNKNPIFVLANTTVQSIAQTMTDNLYGCVIIHENNKPIGIISDIELRSKIATGKFYITTLASSIMNTNMITVAENLSLAEAQLHMLRNQISHLVVTEDGSVNTLIKGIVSQQDIIISQSNNPGVLLKQIKKATSDLELKEQRENLSVFIRISIEKRIALSHISAIASDINMAISKRAIELAILQIGSEPAKFAWLSIGSQGRKEQLLLTDQDNILVFADVAADKYNQVKEYFLKLAQIVNQTLETVGYPKCVNGHVAKNILWCKSLTDWTKQYNNWINTPGEKTDEICNIFFDYEIVYGDFEMEEIITNSIFTNAKDKKKFFAYLGTEALNKPAALNFFKNFNLEESDLHKDMFDIKSKGIMAYVDIARVLTLSNQIKGINNTFLRFKQLSISEPKYKDIYLEAAENFLTLSMFRASEGIKNNNNGQFINTELFSKSDKEKLKNSFGTLKDLEEIVKNKFALTYFS